MDTTLIFILGSMIVVIFVALIFYILQIKRKRNEFIPLSDTTDMYEDIDNSEIIAIRDVSPQSLNNTNMPSFNVNTNNEFSLDAVSEQPRTMASEPKSCPPESPVLKDPSAVLVVYIIAKKNREFVGYELLQTLLAAGFRFGEMSIFHRHEQLNGNGQVLFSLACATEPGIFDINRIGGLRCQGLSMFMRLTSREHNQNSLNLMLDTAYQLAEELDGVVLGSQHEPLTHEIVSGFKQQVEQHLANLG
jgi:cell division protein ZipA